MKGFTFVDFSKSNEKLPQFSKSAPTYRTVHAGYNYEASCPNQECKTYGKKVICPMMAGKQANKKIDVQNISYDILLNATCPVCNSKLRIQDIQNVYFWNCRWELDGQLNDAEDQDDSDGENPGLVHNQGVEKATDSCKTFNSAILQYYQWISLKCTIL